MKKDFCAGMKHTPVFLFYFFMFTGLLNQESLFVKINALGMIF